MSENPFEGSTKDLIQLLETLIGKVGALSGDMQGMRKDMAGLKQDVAGLKQGLAKVEQDLGETRRELKQEIGQLRDEVHRFTVAISKEQDSFKQSIEAVTERKSIVARQEMHEYVADLERRISALEEAERQRKIGEGA